MLFFLQFLVALSAAVCVLVPAVRHPEWRGGFAILSALFLAAAANECERFWEISLPPIMEEPELLPILILLVAGAAIAVVNKGTIIPGLREVARNRRFPLLVWGLLLVSILPNAAKAKWLWIAFLSDDSTHDVREAVSDAVQFLGDVMLLNWAVLFLKDKYKVFGRRTGPHNDLVFEHPLIEVGRGTRRVAYKLGDTGYCVKFYRPPEERAKMKKAVRRDVGWRRFNKYRNSCSEEVHVYNVFRHDMPQDIRERMPEVCERVFHPEWGWGILETYYTNPDGTAIIPYDKELRRQSDPAVKREIYRQARDILLTLIDLAAPFHEPGNLHVLFRQDGSLQLRFVDFEPESKTVVPLEFFWPWYRRRKLRRKSTRFLAFIRRKFSIDIPVETEIG